MDVDITIARAKEPGNLSDQLFDSYVLAVREKAKLRDKIAKLNSRDDDMEENSHWPPCLGMPQALRI